ncbi:ketopantoate reductase family protein [Lachnospiraceae bacterium SGI.085]
MSLWSRCAWLQPGTCTFIAGKDVTLLARGDWYETLRRDGLTIQHKFFSKKETNDKIPVIPKLQVNDVYDVIFVVMQSIQLDGVIPILKENGSQKLVFVGNNFEAKKYQEKLPEKEVFFGFFSAAGQKKGNRLESFYLNEITMGRTDGDNCSDAWIQSIFSGTKVKVTLENKMDDWLKSHVAFIMPFVALAYQSGCDYRNIRHNNELLNRCIDAVKENYDALKSLGYEILPESDFQMVSSRRILAYLFLKLCCYTILGDLCVCDHARNGKREMAALNELLKAEKRRASQETLISDQLDRYIPETCE